MGWFMYYLLGGKFMNGVHSMYPNELVQGKLYAVLDGDTLICRMVTGQVVQEMLRVWS